MLQQVTKGIDSKQRERTHIMKLRFNLLGTDVTIVDTTPPILSNEDRQEATEAWEQAKASGNTKATWQAGNRLFDNGYVLHGQQWVPGRHLR